VLNHYTSTHAASRFVRHVIAQRPAPDRRIVLVNRDLTIDCGDRVTTRTLADEAEILDVLKTMFALHLPPDAAARLRARLAP
jgi:N-hydroxyarylamine O-acetyltransferase